MFYNHHQSHPSPGDTHQSDQYKSQFARQLFTDGSHLTRADLDKLRKENVNLKQKVEICRDSKSKFELLQCELQVLRERVGKVRLRSFENCEIC